MPPITEHAPIDTSASGSEQGVIRTLVHKRFPENVLLTDIRECGQDHFSCAGRIPADHPFFTGGGRTPQQDILFYTEVGRQASLAITHRFLNAALDDVFVFEKSEAAVTPAIWRLPSSADSVTIEIKVRDTIRRKNNIVTRVVADHAMFVGDEHVFGGTGTWTVQSAALFKRLRRSMGMSSSPDTAGSAPDGEASGDPLHSPFDNVVISAPASIQDTAAVGASLIVDRSHSYFFDHPCDHVPGMLLLEGCAQLAVAAVAESGLAPLRHAAITAYRADFTQFVECSLPTMLTARIVAEHGADVASRSAHDAVTVEIVTSQQDAVAGTARLQVGFAI